MASSKHRIPASGRQILRALLLTILTLTSLGSASTLAQSPADCTCLMGQTVTQSSEENPESSLADPIESASADIVGSTNGRCDEPGCADRPCSVEYRYTFDFDHTTGSLWIKDEGEYYEEPTLPNTEVTIPPPGEAAYLEDVGCGVMDWTDSVMIVSGDGEGGSNELIVTYNFTFQCEDCQVDPM